MSQLRTPWNWGHGSYPHNMDSNRSVVRQLLRRKLHILGFLSASVMTVSVRKLPCVEWMYGLALACPLVTSGESVLMVSH